MKNIKLMGIEYDEKKIKVLADYDKYITDTMMERAREQGEVKYIDMHIERENYIDNLSNDDRLTMRHFISAATLLNKKKPMFNIISNIVLIYLTSLVSIFALKITLSILIAGCLTVSLSNLYNKIALKRIMKIISREAK